MINVSMAVMRLQPIHNGHTILISNMLEGQSDVLVVIGSIQEKRTDKNPLSFKERVELLKAVFETKRLHIIGVEDIGTVSKDEWADFVIQKAKKAGYNPICYYAGSYEDGNWFESKLPIKIVDRYTVGMGINATSIREMVKNQIKIDQYIPKNIVSDYIGNIKWG